MSMEELETGLPPDLEHRLELRVHQARIDLSAGRLDDAHEALAKVRRDVKRARLTRIEAKIEEALGLWRERGGKPEEALEHYQRAEELLRSEPPTMRADAVAGKARAFQALGDVRSDCYGVTVNARDLAEVTQADRARVNALVLAGIFLILLVLVRRPWLAAPYSCTPAAGRCYPTKPISPGRHQRVGRRAV